MPAVGYDVGLDGSGATDAQNADIGFDSNLAANNGDKRFLPCRDICKANSANLKDCGSAAIPQNAFADSHIKHTILCWC
jgi:hypothetical protein